MTPGGRAAEIFTDGASRGNPGPAAIGFRIYAADDEILASVGETLGKATNNVAEYTAVIRALEHALDLDMTDVVLKTDSELLVRQVEGAYRVRNAGLKPLHRRVRELLDRFESWSVVHVPRDENTEADGLANDALDGRL